MAYLISAVVMTLIVFDCHFPIADLSK